MSKVTKESLVSEVRRLNSIIDKIKVDNEKVKYTCLAKSIEVGNLVNRLEAASRELSDLQYKTAQDSELLRSARNALEIKKREYESFRVWVDNRFGEEVKLVGELENENIDLEDTIVAMAREMYGNKEKRESQSSRDEPRVG